MALALTKNLSNGYAATYVRVLGVQIDWVTNTAVICVGFYKDQATKNIPGTTPVITKMERVAKKDFPFSYEDAPAVDPRVLAYTYLKTLAYYAGATDC